MQATAAIRVTVDLANYPDLIVVLLGFRAGSVRALPALMRIGRGLSQIARAAPDGLLFDQRFLFAWNHVGIRQYWRDLDSLEGFTRSMPHVGWWRDFLADRHGSGFWHEAYSIRGGMEAIYIDIPDATGFAAFAPNVPAQGPLLSGRGRLAR